MGDKVEDKVGDTVGDKANTVGDIVGDKLGHKLGDTVGDKVPSFLEPCAYMGKEGEVRLQKGGRQSARHPSSLLSSILVI